MYVHTRSITNTNPQSALSEPKLIPTVYKSGLYWRKNFFSFLFPPGILSLENGQLKFKTKDAVIFDAPLMQCSFRFTSFGVIKITIGNNHYDLVGSPGSFAQSFDKSLRDELNQAAQKPVSLPNTGGAMMGIGLVGSNASSGQMGTAFEAVEAVGAVIVLLNTVKGAKTAGSWISILQEQKAKVTGKTMSTKYIYLIFVGGVIIVFLGLMILGSVLPNGN